MQFDGFTGIIGKTNGFVSFRFREAKRHMDYEALNGPKMTEKQIDAYLSRIGITVPVTLDLAGLTRLQQAHLYTVPFENLDIMAGRALSLDHEALFDKIVIRRQGGVCAELNTAYNWLLYSLGFSVTSYNSRVAYPKPIQFRRHRVIGVRLPEGHYITDVGTNLEYSRIPLRLETGMVQTDGAAEYRYMEHEFFGYLQQQRRPGEDQWLPQIGFTLEPQIDLDFVTPLFFYEKHPGSNMSQFPRVSLYRPEGMTAVRDHTMWEERGGLVQSSHLFADWEEEKRFLRTVFHLDTSGL